MCCQERSAILLEKSVADFFVEEVGRGEQNGQQYHEWSLLKLACGLSVVWRIMLWRGIRTVFVGFYELANIAC